MKDYLAVLEQSYPIRRKEEQKSRFRDFIIKEATEHGYTANVETLENKHNNILIGDVDNAKVVFTAHYDTPASSLAPNIMMPRNPILGILYQLTYPFVLAIIALAMAFLAGEVLKLSYEPTVIVYLILYFLLYFLCTRFFDNKHNLNDNTSGVATLLSLMEENRNGNVAFILFDNEEKGKLGSKAFSKAHASAYKNKPVINLDCVGNGNNVIFISKTAAEDTVEYETLKNCVLPSEEFNVYFYNEKGSVSNSDWKNFPCGISVMACKKAPVVGFYTPRIHTAFDTVASRSNIVFLTENLTEFINKL